MVPAFPVACKPVSGTRALAIITTDPVQRMKKRQIHLLQRLQPLIHCTVPLCQHFQTVTKAFAITSSLPRVPVPDTLVAWTKLLLQLLHYLMLLYLKHPLLGRVSIASPSFQEPLAHPAILAITSESLSYANNCVRGVCRELYRKVTVCRCLISPKANTDSIRCATAASSSRIVNNSAVCCNRCAWKRQISKICKSCCATASGRRICQFAPPAV